MPEFAFYSTDIDPTTDPANADPAPETLVVLDQVPILGNASYNLMAGEIGRGAVIQTLAGVVIQDFGVMDGDQRISFSDSDALSAETVADLKTIHETVDGEYFFTDGYDIWRVRFARRGGFKYRRNLFWAQHSQEIYSYEINLIVMASLRREIADFGLSLEAVAGLFEIADCKLPLEAAAWLTEDSKLPLEAAAWLIDDSKLPLQAAAWLIDDSKLPLQAAAWLTEDSKFSLEAVAGGFTPSGSPAGHWSADTITGLSDGDPVGTWPDQTVNSNDLVQATAAAKPAYETDEQNSLSIVRFDGVDDYMTALIGEQAQPTTLFLVYKLVVADESDRWIAGTTSATYRLGLYQMAGNIHMRAATQVDCGLNTDVGNWHVETYLFNGAASAARRDGAAQAPVDAGTAANRGITLGAYITGTLNVQVDFGELILYQNTNELPTDNEAGLKTKWDTP